MKKPARISSLLLLLLFFCAGTAAGSEDCADALREAQRDFRDGLLVRVLEVRPACLDTNDGDAEDGDATTDQKVAAWALVAKVYLVEDLHDNAARAVDALVGLDPDFAPALNDPVPFAELVREKKGARYQARVASVSKVDEPLREAPATVIVVTAEEIEKRGYTDLEELLHDLPGFDISRGNGEVYSNIYMRGYRSDRSDRLLFLVDGVEQNDLHSNTAYISRQYPMSNIDRVEVVYGPASTIYGANAFNGVISVTTKSPEAFIEEGRNLGFSIQAGAGSFGTTVIDATIAGRTPKSRLRWSLTGRSFRSDEQNLSGFPNWNYDPEDLATLDYEDVLRIDGALADSLQMLCEAIERFGCQVIKENGNTTLVPSSGTITNQRIADIARENDQALFDLLQGRDNFWDKTDDWAIDGRLEVQNLVVGVQSWRRQEGTAPWYTDTQRAGGPTNVWTPRQTNVYARYSHPIGSNLQLNLFLRFKSHETDGDTSLARFVTFAGGNLNLINAIFVPFDGIKPAFQEVTFDQQSTQNRNELALIYQPNERFNLVSGIELRRSSIQLDYRSTVHAQQPINEMAPYTATTFFETQVTDTKSDVTDQGVFVQASFKPREDFKIVVGGRWDENSIRNQQSLLAYDRKPTGEIPGSQCSRLGPFPCNLRTQTLPIEAEGGVFNPRLALVHTRDNFVFKGIYSEAFKAPSNLQRFSREPGVRDFLSDDLQSEKVKNTEIAMIWEPRRGISLDIAAFQSDYSNAVGVTRSIPQEILNNAFAALSIFPIVGASFDNLGRLRIRGFQANARTRWGDRRQGGLYELFGSYSYTDPVNLDPTDELGNPIDGTQRVGDIASHRLNLGVDMQWGKALGANLRANWVDARPTGEGTTVAENPLSEVDGYLVANAALRYNGFPDGGQWQLVIRNLFDTEYEHPGVQRAGQGFAPLLPQPGRTFLFRFRYKR